MSYVCSSFVGASTDVLQSSGQYADCGTRYGSFDADVDIALMAQCESFKEVLQCVVDFGTDSYFALFQP